MYICKSCLCVYLVEGVGWGLTSFSSGYFNSTMYHMHENERKCVKRCLIEEPVYIAASPNLII